MSYTTFEIGNLRLSSDRLDADGSLTLRVDVTNTGDRCGAEVVQLYVGDAESTLARPTKELKGFAKVSLAPGETQTVEFGITPEALSYYDDTKGAWTAEPGLFTAYVGAASDDIRGSVDFTLE